MKKTVGVILFLTGNMWAMGQNASFGPTVGINGWENGDNKAKIGLNVGATFTYSIDPHWGIGADLKFSQEGGGKMVTSATAVQKADITENYIRLPLKVLYFFGQRGQRLRPKLYAGSSFGFLVGGKINGTYSTTAFGVPVVYTSEQKSLDYLKHFDLGVLVGTGFNYRLKPGTWLNVDLGYTGGLMNVVKSDTQASTILSTAHNHNLSLNVGVTFPLGSVKHVSAKSKSKRK